MIAQTIITSLLAYLFGAIPFAYILVKKSSGIDLSSEGSGNIGAMNSYDVTHKKWIGISVTILDALKGALAVFLARIITHDILAVSLSFVFVVLGHNFNIFLKFKGGRGLAPSVGASLMINWYFIILWGLMWIAGYFIIRKHVHIANVTASICTPLMIYYTPDKLLTKTSMLLISKNEMIIVTSIVCLLILIRHIKPIINLMKNNKKNEKL